MGKMFAFQILNGSHPEEHRAGGGQACNSTNIDGRNVIAWRWPALEKANYVKKAQLLQNQTKQRVGSEVGVKVLVHQGLSTFYFSIFLYLISRFRSFFHSTLHVWMLPFKFWMEAPKNKDWAGGAKLEIQPTMVAMTKHGNDQHKKKRQERQIIQLLQKQDHTMGWIWSLREIAVVHIFLNLYLFRNLISWYIKMLRGKDCPNLRFS